MTAVTATTASPPGRFSITTGWPHRLVNRSPRRRVPKSTPLPGPRVTMNLTGRCGQVCAIDGETRIGNMRSARPSPRRATAHRFVSNMGRLLLMLHTISAISYTCQTAGVDPRRRCFQRASATYSERFAVDRDIEREAGTTEACRCGHIRHRPSCPESSGVCPLSPFMVLERCTAVTLSDEVFQALVKAILSGEVEPGARLDEPSICRKFGVSRTPIREALRRLSGTGLVEVTPWKG